MEALRAGRPRALVAAREYLETLVKEMEKFRLSLAGVKDQPEVIRSSIDQFIPYRNQFIDFVSTLTNYAPGSEADSILHRFFEQTLAVCHKRVMGAGTSWDNANLSFIVYEIFLNTIAVQLRHEEFAMAGDLINRPYFVGDLDDFHGTEMITYNAFQPPNDPFRAWWNGKERTPISAVGDLINDRVGHGDISMRHICAVDLLLCLRSALDAEDYRRWVSFTTVYAGHSRSALEIFARCQSKDYFDNIRNLLGVSNVEEFRQRVAQFDQDGRRGYVTMSSFGTTVSVMTGAERIASRP